MCGKADIYRFDFTLSVDVATVAHENGVAGVTYTGTLPDVTETSPDGNLLFQTLVEGETEAGYLAFQLDMNRVDDAVDIVVGDDPVREESRFFARIHPDLDGVLTTQSSTSEAVFLIDTSLSEHPGHI